MSPTPTLLETVLQLLTDMGELRTRKMFGGVYIYCNDLFIATVHDNTLYLKANENTVPEFIARQLKPFSYPSASGTITLQYYQAPAQALQSKAQMKPWASKALLAAQQDAARKRPKKSKS